MTKILTNPQGKAYISSGGKALLSTGSGSATLITKTITQNGTYNASSDNADGYSSVTVNVGGTPTPTGKYQLFDRVKENSIEIGTVCGFFTDANDVEYAVVVLDYTFRQASTDNKKFLSSSTDITDLPYYNGNGDVIKLITNVYTNTATFNCDKIIAYCNSHSSYTSSACTYCRSLDFTIDGTTYYGQIPNTYELFQIALNHERLGALDPTDENDYHKSLIKLPAKNIIGSDLGNTRGRIATLYQSGVVNNNGNMTDALPVYPILELPNALS